MLKSWLYVTFLLLLAATVLLAFLSGDKPAVAQTASMDWTYPINLSNSPESSGRPDIVADSYGLVHVFWSEEVGGESILDIPEQLLHNGNTIFYTRWDGFSWTEPIDILFVPNDPIAEYIAVTVDAENRLHAVWTGESNFYYSAAPAWQADSAHSWSTPIVVATDSARSTWESDIATDSSGAVHIVYATRSSETGVYHVRSQDGGATWGSPHRLSESLDRLEKNYSNVRITVDGGDCLHVLWQTNEEEGYGQGVYYTRSVDGGDTWEAPVRMAYRDPNEYGVSFPYMAAIGESELHMIYIDGAWHIGRWQRISHDGGATWSEPFHILSNLEGINGYTIPLVDGAGGLHLVTTMRTRDQVAGPFFYARWLGTEWSPSELPFLGSDDTGTGAHWTAVTVRLGNEIHVLWNTNFSHKAGEIWYSRASIPHVPQVPPLPVPATDVPSPVPTTASATAIPAATPTTPPTTATPMTASADPSGASPGFTSEAVPLLVGVVPSLLLITSVVVWARARAR